MFGLSRFEWLLLCVALFLCPGFSWGTEPQAAAGDEARNRNWIAVDRDRDGRISRSEFNLVSVPSASRQPSAAAGTSTRPPKPE